MRVTFDPAASAELDRIFAWIAKDNPRAAIEIIARIEAKVMRLEVPELTNMAVPAWSMEPANFSNGRTSSSTKCTRSGMKLLSCLLSMERKTARRRRNSMMAATRDVSLRTRWSYFKRIGRTHGLHPDP